MATNTPRNRITLAAAGVTSAVGLAMAAASAMDRGSTLTDRTLIVAVACVLVLGAHLLPAISTTWKGRALWVGCLALTAWGHAVFFAASAHRAGSLRADAVQTSLAAQAIQAELDSLSATRPVAAVSAELATTRARAESAQTAAARCNPDTNANECRRRTDTARAAALRAEALADELAQARRVATLRQQIGAAAQQHDAARQTAEQDPVAAALSQVTGIRPGALITAVSVLSSLMVELMAALLWSSAINPGPKTQHDPQYSDEQKEASFSAYLQAASKTAPSQQQQDDLDLRAAQPPEDHSVHGLQPDHQRPWSKELPFPGCLCPMHAPPDGHEAEGSGGAMTPTAPIAWRDPPSRRVDQPNPPGHRHAH
jgi:hypothetical protein